MPKNLPNFFPQIQSDAGGKLGKNVDQNHPVKPQKI